MAFKELVELECQVWTVALQKTALRFLARNFLLVSGLKIAKPCLDLDPVVLSLSEHTIVHHSHVHISLQVFQH